MKFAVAVISTLALVLGVQSSVIPWHGEIAGHGLSYTAVSGPHHAWGHPHAAVEVHHHTPAVVHVPHVPHVPAIHTVHVPTVVIDHHAHSHGHIVAHHDHHDHHHDDHHDHHAHVVVAHPAHDGIYVAKTRGAVHTAPLAGHANSVTSVNVEPAPGTV